MSDWTISYEEVSNNVWMVSITHIYGSKVELSGTDLDALIDQAKHESFKLEEQINLKYSLKRNQ